MDPINRYLTFQVFFIFFIKNENKLFFLVINRLYGNMAASIRDKDFKERTYLQKIGGIFIVWKDKNWG